MKSMIFHGGTRHARVLPRAHAFRYRMFWLAIDLNDLAGLDQHVRGFGYNRSSVASIHDRDYIDESGDAIHIKVRRVLEAKGIARGVERIVLLTVPRVLGYVFNPVSFFLCLGAGGRLVAILAEVRNTFGERHVYTMTPRPQRADAGEAVCTVPKEFFVSPFFEVAGEYVLRVTRTESDIDLRIELQRQGALGFAASMTGSGQPLTSASLRSTLVRFPWFAAAVMVRIKWQALQLYFRRQLPVYAKPDPPVPPLRVSFWHRLRERVIARLSDDSGEISRQVTPRLDEELSS